jgi:hypothetical protein
MTVPKASAAVVNAAIAEAVEQGKVWLLAGPASLLGESIPAGVLAPAATLRRPPAPLSAASLLPDNLPAAWQDGAASALAIATSLSQTAGSHSALEDRARRHRRRASGSVRRADG